ncbi:thiamine pyrophosphokinase [Acrasis kona]|uniref:Thiamine pyrophosphokinase n=1 Tax=Acrasis kona TaxID=1008807 RepID=A0AAW2Z7V5_9EUKA
MILRKASLSTHNARVVWSNQNSLAKYFPYLTCRRYSTKSIQHYNDFYSRTDDSSNFNLIILNTPITDHLQFKRVFDGANYIVCADGGANRLYQLSNKLIPNAVCGDLDSIQENIMDYYKQNGSEIVKYHDQDSNDLEKSINFVSSKGENKQIVIFGGGGRLDQEMCNINILYKAMHEQPQSKMVLVSSSSVYFVLSPNIKHIIKRNVDFEQKGCGIIPIGVPCESISTRGLKWNLDSNKLSFGGTVSSSNEFDVNNQVEVMCSQPVLWVTTLKNEI